MSGDDETEHSAFPGIAIEWCGSFAATELDDLFVDMAQPHPLVDGTMPRFRLLDDYGWHRFLDEHAVGWVVARDNDGLAGFAHLAPDVDGVSMRMFDLLVARRVDRAALTSAMATECAAEVATPVASRDGRVEPPSTPS